ncbi:MAG: hypothetical protein NC923_03025 [Candidatus Omnitrophica bacterium]|nr:hypothetical protein [Candidatus Omnitrophota bacterium]
MIEINLLPEELRAKESVSDEIIEESLIKFTPKNILLLLPLIAAATVIITLSLCGVSIFKGTQLSRIEKRWRALEQQRKIVKEFAEQNWLLSQEAAVIKNYLDKRVNWAEKLNKLSLYLPRGIWFNALAVSAKDLIIQASVFSLQKEEMNLISRFIEQLKKDPAFSKDFKSIELGSVQKRLAGGYEIIDFILNFALKK